MELEKGSANNELEDESQPMVLSRSGIVEIAEQFLQADKHAMIKIIIAEPAAAAILAFVFWFLYFRNTSGDYSAVFGILAFIFGVSVIVGLRDFMDPFLKYGSAGKRCKLIRENVPVGNFILRRVMLQCEDHDGMRRGDSQLRLWYYVFDDKKRALNQHFRWGKYQWKLNKDPLLFPGSAEAFQTTLKQGTDVTPPTSLVRKKRSNVYFYLLFIQDEPCLILPETDYRLGEDVALTEEKPDN